MWPAWLQCHHCTPGLAPVLLALSPPGLPEPPRLGAWCPSPVSGTERGAGLVQQFHMLFQGSQGDSKNAKKKNNKKTNKNKSSISRANKKKPSMPNVSNDLSQKLYATMEKHKEVETRGGGGLAGSRGCGLGPFLVCGIKEKRLLRSHNPGPEEGKVLLALHPGPTSRMERTGP